MSRLRLNESLALTHALESVAKKQELLPAHREELSAELDRIVKSLTGASSGAPANEPDKTGIVASLNFDEKSGRLSHIVFEKGAPRSVGDIDFGKGLARSVGDIDFEKGPPPKK
jgi:hypothetical protein